MSAMAGLPTKTDSTGWSNRRIRPWPTGSVNPSPALALIVTDCACAGTMSADVRLRHASVSIDAREQHADNTLYRADRRPSFPSGTRISHPGSSGTIYLRYDI